MLHGGDRLEIGLQLRISVGRDVVMHRIDITSGCS